MQRSTRTVDVDPIPEPTISDGGAIIEHAADAARPLFESWMLLAKRGQVLAVYVDGVELSRAEWEADGDRIHLRGPGAATPPRTAVTAVVRRAGASYIVDAEPAREAANGGARA